MTNEEILEALREFIKVSGRVPERVELEGIDSLPSRNTFSRRFGSYKKAVESLGYSVKNRSGSKAMEKDCSFCGSAYTTYRDKQEFCSQSCANKSRSIEKKCTECGKSHKRYSDFCSTTCRMVSTMKSEVMSDFFGLEQNKYRAIRGKGISYHKAVGKPDSCQKCGYDKHVECCHIKPLKEFEDNSTIWECNRPENVMFMCPNCHWEFDNGFIDMDEIMKLKASVA